MPLPSLPADFDPAEYLRIHKDVADAKVDAAEHYLNFGFAEGREYKEGLESAPIQKFETIIVTKPDLFKERLGKETLLVTGSSRGATSLVAYTLLRMGYPLLANQHVNHEHSDFVEATGKHEEISRVIDRNNEQFSRWGFKLPAAALDLNWYVDNLREPIVLMVYRNALAIVRSIQKHETTWDQGEKGIKSALCHAEKFLSAVHVAADCDAPALLLDVDLAQRKPDALVRDISSLFGLEMKEEVAQEISIPGYKAIKA